MRVERRGEEPAAGERAAQVRPRQQRDELGGQFVVEAAPAARLALVERDPRARAGGRVGVQHDRGPQRERRRRVRARVPQCLHLELQRASLPVLERGERLRAPARGVAFDEHQVAGGGRGARRRGRQGRDERER